MTRSNQFMQFGALQLPPSAATSHVLFSGTTGSGKTTLLRLLQESQFTEIRPGNDWRAIVNDPKQDVLPFLQSIAPEATIVITHPFDQRCSAWDMSADIDSPQLAVEFCYTLIPPTSEPQQFFNDASRHCIYGVIISFQLSGISWTFADLIRVLSSPRILRHVLKRHWETAPISSYYLSEKRLRANVLATIASKLLPFGPIAACWDRATSKFSLSQWAVSPMILVLGSSDISRTPVQTLNRCIFKRAADITLEQPDSETRRTWFGIDELSDAGKLDGIVALAKKGRSKGACLSVAFQSIAGLRDPSLYGPHLTEEFLAQFGHKFVGRMECASSAEWASALVGDQEVNQKSYSYTTGQHPTSTTTIQKVTRRGVLPSQILDFPPCNLENGLTGLFFAPSVGVFVDSIDGHELFVDGAPVPASIPAFLPCPKGHQFLQPWTPEQADALQIPTELLATPGKPSANSRAKTTAKPLSFDDLFA
ncbi:MAG: type IV secretion system DNA-binding domain-containing protein [Planctomycetaceae bacterium]|nr:type IV secretion system DNA-binding domain-containing protein [Planctomycetaceae bacterium]